MPRPKTLSGNSSGNSGGLGEASTVVAERLADWQHNLSDQVSLTQKSSTVISKDILSVSVNVIQNDSPPESRLPPDPVMPELHHQGSSSDMLASASGAQNLASSFKDKMKIDKKCNESQADPKKVMVEVRPGGIMKGKISTIILTISINKRKANIHF